MTCACATAPKGISPEEAATERNRTVAAARRARFARLMQTNDSYLSPVGLHLIYMPDASRAQLVAANSGALVPEVPPGAEHAIISVRLAPFLTPKEPFAPPEAPTVIAFEKEEGLFDTVRMTYERSGFRFEIGHTQWVASLTIYPYRDLADAPAPERAARAVQVFLDLQGPVEFHEVGRLPGVSYGRRNVAAGAHLAPRDEELRYWIEGERVSFVTARKEGGLSQQPEGSGSARANRDWFEFRLNYRRGH